MNASQDIKSNLNNSSIMIDSSFTGSKEGRKEKKGEDHLLQIFLRDTEEINDIIITNGKGDVTYYHSRYDTLDEEFLRSFKDDFRYNYANQI
jgi:hypothetical protein